MQRSWLKYAVAAQAVVAVGALAQMNTDARRQTPDQAPLPGATDNTSQHPTGGALDTNRSDTMTHRTTQAPGTIRVSNLIGTEVYDRQNKHVGEIKDVVLSHDDEKVGYVVVSFGGIAGLGDKLFAMPYKMIQYSTSGSDARSKAYVNVDEQTLKNAPGFDKNQWPAEANADYYQKLDQYYSSNTGGATANAADRMKEAGNAAKDTMTQLGQQTKESMHDTGQAMKDAASNRGDQAIPAGAQVDHTGLQWTRRGSELIGATVEDPNNTKLGKVSDIVLDWQSGKVKYAVLDYGSTLGMGGKLFAVPIDQFKVDPRDNRLTLNVTKDQLQNAPGFDRNQWPDMADPNWNKQVNDYYHAPAQPGAAPDMNR